MIGEEVESRCLRFRDDEAVCFRVREVWGRRRIELLDFFALGF